MGNMISCCSKKSEDFSDKNSQRSTIGNKSSPKANKNFSKNYPVNKFVQYYKEENSSKRNTIEKEQENGGNIIPQTCPSNNYINRQSFLIQESIKIDSVNKSSKHSTEEKNSCCSLKGSKIQEKNSGINPILQIEETLSSNDNKDSSNLKSGPTSNENYDNLKPITSLENTISPSENGRKSNDSEHQKDELKSLIGKKNGPDNNLTSSDKIKEDKRISEEKAFSNKYTNTSLFQTISKNLEKTDQIELYPSVCENDSSISKPKKENFNEEKNDEFNENQTDNTTKNNQLINEKEENILKPNNLCCQDNDKDHTFIALEEITLSKDGRDNVLLKKKEDQNEIYEKSERNNVEQLDNYVRNQENNSEIIKRNYTNNSVFNQNDDLDNNDQINDKKCSRNVIQPSQINCSSFDKSLSLTNNYKSENVQSEKTPPNIIIDNISSIEEDISKQNTLLSENINKEELQQNQIIEQSTRQELKINKPDAESNKDEENNQREKSNNNNIISIACSQDMYSIENSAKNKVNKMEKQITNNVSVENTDSMNIQTNTINQEVKSLEKIEEQNKDNMLNKQSINQEKSLSNLDIKLDQNDNSEGICLPKIEYYNQITITSSQYEISDPSLKMKNANLENLLQNNIVKELQIDAQINHNYEISNKVNENSSIINKPINQIDSNEMKSSEIENVTESVDNNKMNLDKCESSSNEVFQTPTYELNKLNDIEKNTNEAFDFDFKPDSGKYERKTVSILRSDRQKLKMLLNENIQPNTNPKFLPDDIQINMEEDKGGQMMEKRKKLIDSSSYAVQYSAPSELTEKKQTSTENTTPVKVVSTASTKGIKSEFVTKKVEIPVQTSEFEYSEPRKRMTVTGFSKPIVSEDYKPSRRHTVVAKSHQKSLIKNTVKPEKFLENFKHKINLSVFLEDNKILDNFSIMVYSLENKEYQLLGEIFYQNGIQQSNENSQFYFDFSFEIIQNIVIKIISENQILEYPTTLAQVLTNPSNKLTFKTENYTLVLKANVVKNDEKELFSVFSVRYAFKIISMQPKVVSYKMWRYKENSLDGDLLYESEEQSSQKIFQFCDALINREMIINKNDLFCIEIYEKENMIGKTKSLDLKQLTTSKKGIEIYDNKNKEVGTKLDIQYSERKSKNFIDYLSNGITLNYIIAIDFTSSNSDYVKKESLHNIDSEQLNIYETLIMNIGKIIQSYDKCHEYTVYGFGGIPPEKDAVSHSFFVNLKNEPTIIGLNNLLENYRSTLPKLRFLGPTYFRFFVKNIIDKVKKSHSNKDQVYYISLILTDGQINDMEETIDLFVEASKLPISFIIVGVGNENFNDMYILDRTKHSLINSKGEKALRDAVHFVVYNDFLNFQVFTEACLKEIPYQIEEYYRFQSVNLN